MSSIDARASGQFRIGDITINRLGYGAMRITGPGIWGAPSDRDAALATLRRLPEINVNFIDTADSYGPDVSEQLIREALHPYEGLLIATKAGLTRQGPDRWTPNVLAYCGVNNIGFIPWFPLAAGELTRPGGVVDRVANAHGATAGQVALAWLLQRSPVMLPIPGTLHVAHLEENVAAASVSLTPQEIADLDTAA
jgi:aryl-alcohol dehydrogenase-like predicted oxidoreductase